MHHNAYWRAVESTARDLESDGCTWATEAYHLYCLEHDIHYRTHAYLDGSVIDKETADQLFRDRMRAASVLGVYSPIAFLRYHAVRLFGEGAWNHFYHR